MKNNGNEAHHTDLHYRENECCNCKKMLADRKIRGIIEIQGGFQFSKQHPGDCIEEERNLRRYNDPPIFNKSEGGDKVFTSMN